MNTYWAIEWTPLSKRSKPWIDYLSLRARRKDVIADLYGKATPGWRENVDARRKKGLIRIVRVRVEIKEVRGES